MKNTILNILSAGLMIILLISCELVNTGDNENSTKSNLVEILSSGSVSGTVNEDATVILEQSDGTSQQLTATTESPEYFFENVPIGEIILKIDNGTNIVSQEINVAEDEVTNVYPFGSSQEMLGSFEANIYEVKWEASKTSISSIQTDRPLGDTFYAKEINIPPRKFLDGFPGLTDRFEWFGVIYTGEIKAPVSGTYTFRLTSDDGSKLYVDDVEIIDGDGLHPAESFEGTIDLTAGEIYDFEIKYFQGPREYICLIFEVQIPGEDMKLFDYNDFID